MRALEGSDSRLAAAAAAAIQGEGPRLKCIYLFIIIDKDASRLSLCSFRRSHWVVLYPCAVLKSSRLGPSVGLRLSELLQGLTLAAHEVIAQGGGDVMAALAQVKVHGRLVPVQDGKVHQGTTSRQAQL